MTKEQGKAIERLEKRIKDNEDYKTTQVWLTDDVSAVYTVLNMLKDLQRKNKRLTQTNKSYKGIISKQNRQINLMAMQLAGLTIWNDEKEEPIILGDKKEVIKYFERKSEE